MALEGAAGAGAGAGGGAAMPRTVDEIFRDYKGRWAAMIKALTSEVEEFYKQCDPEKENLCLYGYPEEIWEVNLPAEEIPPELPEPALGINFAREGMEQRDWLSLVAVHSDAWLLAVASFFSARLEKPDRKRLFLMIMELPTIFEVVSGRKTAKEKTSASNGPPSKSKSSGKVNKSSTKPVPEPKEEESYEEEEEDEDADADADADEDEDDEEEEEQGETFCGSCGGLYKGDGFWIGCDVCEKWFHGKCVKITPAKAEHIKKYKCPSCNTNKRA